MDRFLDMYILPKLIQEDTENLNVPNTKMKTESIFKTLPTKKSPGPDFFTAELFQSFQEDLTPILLKIFQTMEREVTKLILPSAPPFSSPPASQKPNDDSFQFSLTNTPTCRGSPFPVNAA